MIRRPPRSTLFPYTTLFRSHLEFLQGEIEDLALPAASVDVVISNNSINLSADKDAVFREMFRVLKPGGDRKSTRLNSSHLVISYAVFCLQHKKTHSGAWSTR